MSAEDFGRSLNLKMMLERFAHLSERVEDSAVRYAISPNDSRVMGFREQVISSTLPRNEAVFEALMDLPVIKDSAPPATSRAIFSETVPPTEPPEAPLTVTPRTTQRSRLLKAPRRPPEEYIEAVAGTE
jgi:hypothetical protein